jgi:hypothetical protein
MAANKRLKAARVLKGLTRLGRSGCAPMRVNSIGKTGDWIRAAVGTAFAVGAILCLVKGRAPAETIAFVAATHALLKDRVGPRSRLQRSCKPSLPRFLGANSSRQIRHLAPLARSAVPTS